MGVNLRNSLNNGLNTGLRQSISGGPGVAFAFLEYTTVASTSSFTLRSTGTVDYEVDWGDGTVESYTTNTPTHTYSTADTYTIKITPADGSTYRPYFANNVSDTSIAKVNGTGGSQLGTTLQQAWQGSSNMTFFSADIDTSGVTGMRATWHQCSGLTSFPLIDTSGCTFFFQAWSGCSGLTSFPLIDTSSGTNFSNAWAGCSGLTSFPLLDTSSGDNFALAWKGCSGLTSFPLIDTSSGGSFYAAWQNCSGLTSFPAIDFSSATQFNQAWRSCSSLATFPANMFDTTGTLVSNAFSSAFNACALTAQSIENILVSLDANGQSNNSLHIGGGTNAAKTTWSTAANNAYDNLIADGWTITYNA